MPHFLPRHWRLLKWFFKFHDQSIFFVSADGLNTFTLMFLVMRSAYARERPVVDRQSISGQRLPCTLIFHLTSFISTYYFLRFELILKSPIDGKTLWKIWASVVGKPSKSSIAKARADANYIENGPLLFADMEAILLEGMKSKNTVPTINQWYK